MKIVDPKYYWHELVEVKSLSEILQTLNAEGKLEGLPFMPEMIALCGRQIRVHRRADRTCVAGGEFRRMKATVFLQESRCDGSSHDGCQRGCLLFWKEAWLRPAAAPRPVITDSVRHEDATRALQSLITRRADRYVCQATELLDATAGEISRWDARPFVREVLHGELTVKGFLAIAARAILNRCFRWGRTVLAGTSGKKRRGNLGLRQGEWVKVKSSSEIREQLDPNGNNCGLAFRPTMTVAIGGRYQVAFPIRKIITEKTGKMVDLKNTVVLKGITCQGLCAANCPRSEYLYWRESWLDRTDQKD
jgi:hypothetical protein